MDFFTVHFFSLCCETGIDINYKTAQIHQQKNKGVFAILIGLHVDATFYNT